MQELVESLSLKMKGLGLMLVTAESCTGGMVAAAMTDRPGSSEILERGFVTYSNDAKMEMLGVTATTLERHGAVSEATARAMAQGALKHSRATWALAITGIAGPTGGTPGKPVGMVCLAWAQRNGGCEALTCQFAGTRAEVRQQAVRLALSGALKRVMAATLMA